MAHYKNIVRCHDDFDLELNGQKIYVLDDREKFDKDSSGRTTIKGPRIIIKNPDGSITDCKIRDENFWAAISLAVKNSSSDCEKKCSEQECCDEPKKKSPKKKSKKAAEPKNFRKDSKFIGRDEDGISG
jgi:hypothetical protein